MGEESCQLCRFFPDVAEAGAHPDDVLDTLVEFPNAYFETIEEEIGALKIQIQFVSADEDAPNEECDDQGDTVEGAGNHPLREEKQHHESCE